MGKRTYNRWTPAEDAMIERGEIPPNRQYASCFIRAERLGFKFSKKGNGLKWSKRLDELVRGGIIPTGRSMKECVDRARVLGFDFMKVFFEASPEQSIVIARHTDGMLASEALSVALENNWSTKAYKVKTLTDAELGAYKRGRRLFLKHARSDMSLQDIADAEGMTRQNVHRLIERFKIHYFDENCFDAVVKGAVDED